MKDRLYIRATNNIMDDTIQIRLRLRTNPDSDTRLPYTSIPEPITFKEISKEQQLSCPQEPTLIIHANEAQELMNDLWNCGIRPEQAKESTGQLEAINKHLEDMRTLVFKTNK